MTEARRLAALSAYRRENGTLQLLLKMLVASRRRLRDYSISRQVGCSRLRLGRAPKIYGRRHLSIGLDFSAGDFLWLEAVTEHCGIPYDPAIKIGNGVGVSDFVHIAATNEVVIGDGVLIGSRVLVTDHNHGIYEGAEQVSPEQPPNARRLTQSRTVAIGRNVWIGDGVAVLAGARIGDCSVIGANSVVVGAIPPNCIAAGMPARPIRFYDPAMRVWKKAATHA